MSFVKGALGFAVIALFLSLCPGQVSGEARMPQKYALLIGVNDYRGTTFDTLRGARNDVELMDTVLRGRFQFDRANIRVLLDSEASHEGIRSAMESLARQVQTGDMVYIHYSGHGSRTADLNGDEKGRSGLDSTWVSFSSRSKGQSGQTPYVKPSAGTRSQASGTPTPGSQAETGLNDFDILDDQINHWLADISGKTDQIVFVSDSCHSGTITRGSESLKTRGVPLDTRKHPLGKEPPTTKPMFGVRVSAARDNEKASEYESDRTIYGRFTWFWARSMTEAASGDTWHTLFLRARVRLNAAGGGQEPQMEGDRNMTVFGGEVSAPTPLIAIRDVSPDQTRVYLNAGSLAGVTVGSIYRKHPPDRAKGGEPHLKTVRVSPGWSEAECQAGAFKLGDLVVLKSYQPAMDPIRVLIRDDPYPTPGLVEKMKQMVTGLPGFQLAEAGGSFDIILQVVRPKYDRDGQAVYRKSDDSLPRSFAEVSPECWVLAADERLYAENMKVSLGDQTGIARLGGNLVKMARVKNLIALTGPGSGDKDPLVGLSMTVWREADKADPDAVEFADGHSRKADRTLDAREFETMTLKVNQCLTFGIHNRTKRPYYTYLVNITEKGDIIPFYPPMDRSMEDGLLLPGQRKRIEEVSLVLDAAQREYVRLVASLDPVDIYLLTQEGYQKYRKGVRTRGSMNSLEALLCSKAGITRGEPARGFAGAEWTTSQVALYIEP